MINLTTRDLTFATDYCGVKSGRDVDKFKELGLHISSASEVSAPLLDESPVNIECRVTQVLRLGTHDMFVAKVVSVHADEKYMDENGKFSLEKADPIAYSHGTYYTLGVAFVGSGWFLWWEALRKSAYLISTFIMEAD